MRVVFLFFVEYPCTQPVERLQVRFDTRGLIGLLSRIFANEELCLPFGTLFTQQGLEDLLIKRVLQLIVFDVPVHVSLPRHVFVQLKIPTNKVGISFVSQETFYNVIHAFILSDEPQGFGRTSFFLAVRVGGVAIPDQEAELF